MYSRLDLSFAIGGQFPDRHRQKRLAMAAGNLRAMISAMVYKQITNSTPMGSAQR
jgi:hypothetical protein